MHPANLQTAQIRSRVEQRIVARVVGATEELDMCLAPEAELFSRVLQFTVALPA